MESLKKAQHHVRASLEISVDALAKISHQGEALYRINEKTHTLHINLHEAERVVNKIAHPWRVLRSEKQETPIASPTITHLSMNIHDTGVQSSEMLVLQEISSDLYKLHDTALHIRANLDNQNMLLDHITGSVTQNKRKMDTVSSTCQNILRKI